MPSFYYLRTVKLISRRPFYLCKNFEVYLIQMYKISYTFSFFVQKRIPKTFGVKNVMKRGIRKFSLSQYVKLHLKFSDQSPCDIKKEWDTVQIL